VAGTGVAHTDQPFPFGKVLREYRQAAGLTQEALAEMSGVSIRGIQDLERGGSRPQKGTIQRLADALKLSAEALAEFTLVTPTPRKRTTADRGPAVGAARYAIPQPLTSLIGRDHDAAAVVDMLCTPHVRLLTLTGPGGIGKTRLALHVVHDPRLSYAEGVVFVDLSAATAPHLVPSAIGQALGLGDLSGRPLLEQLVSYLREKRMLLLLDNFEQVLEAAPVIAQLLVNCPQLQVLTTSRAALRVRGEHVFPVPPLALPPSAEAGVEGLSRYPAVALFTQCAQTSQAGFRLTDETAPVVAEICARLDGLPLAIELAAARANVLSPSVLLQRLEQRLDLLVAGPRDLPERQQTLRGTLVWSCEQLSSETTALFSTLSVFVGGWSLEAAEKVCAVGSPEENHAKEGEESIVRDVPVLGIHAGLEELVNHSLVIRETVTESQGIQGRASIRFRMLETIREYGLERLEASGRADAVRRRHALYYLDLALAAEPELTGPRQVLWFERLKNAHANIRAALDWSVDNDVILGLRLAGALWRFWNTHSHLSEGRWRLERLLEAPGSAAPEALQARAKALYGAGVLANEQADYPRVITLGEEVLRLSRSLGDNKGVASALNILALSARIMGDIPRATALHEESLVLARMLDDPNGMARAMSNLGVVATDQGKYALAAQRYEEALSIYRAMEDEQGIAILIVNLAEVLRFQEAYDRAAILYRESLRMHHKGGNQVGVLACLEGLAALLRVTGDPERAATLLGAADVLRTKVGAGLHSGDKTDYDRNLAALHAELAPSVMAAAWAGGSRMSVEQAVAYAEEHTARPSPPFDQ
jgi:predicted ATPase/transcriptional regulator with XRE-family HTH domain